MTDTVCAHPRAFIFDCDGTLVRSMGMWIELGPQVLADYGVSVTGDDLARFETLSMYGECCAYHDTWGVGNDGDEIYGHMMELLLERYRTVVPARDGVKEFLESVKAAGIPMCIATSTPAHAVRCGLSANGLDGYFDVIVTTQPPPSALPISKVPPCSRTISSHTARPIPLPLALDEPL